MLRLTSNMRKLRLSLPQRVVFICRDGYHQREKNGTSDWLPPFENYFKVKKKIERKFVVALLSS